MSLKSPKESMPQLLHKMRSCVMKKMDYSMDHVDDYEAALSHHHANCRESGGSIRGKDNPKHAAANTRVYYRLKSISVSC